MIATLSGALAVRDAGRIVIETGGVGYEVLIPLSTYYRLPQIGERVALMIRQVVREDALLLYGFSSATEKRAFDLLMSVQHVGPKLALAILSVLAPEELVTAIGSGNRRGAGCRSQSRRARRARTARQSRRLEDVGAVHQRVQWQSSSRT
jgi:Holliday junction DNA helicase RuvA